MSPQTIYPVVPLAEAMKVAVGNMAVHQPVVMIVDDEKIIADTLSAIFRQNGYSVLTAYDGRTALELAAGTPPDLVITDVMMPQMNGIDLAIALESLLPACKILLFSGQATTMDLLASARTMGHDFTTISKPVHPTEMLRRASETLRTPRAA
jgi:CheY-like chemotaxis protein